VQRSLARREGEPSYAARLDTSRAKSAISISLHLRARDEVTGGVRGHDVACLQSVTGIFIRPEIIGRSSALKRFGSGMRRRCRGNQPGSSTPACWRAVLTASRAVRPLPLRDSPPPFALSRQSHSSSSLCRSRRTSMSRSRAYQPRVHVAAHSSQAHAGERKPSARTTHPSS
jgi:hypothetical protein